MTTILGRVRGSFWWLAAMLAQLLLIMPLGLLSMALTLVDRPVVRITTFAVRHLYWPAVQEKRRHLEQPESQPYDQLIANMTGAAGVDDFITCGSCASKYLPWPDDMEICPECHLPKCDGCRNEVRPSRKP